MNSVRNFAASFRPQVSVAFLGLPLCAHGLVLRCRMGVLYLLADPARVSKALMYVVRDLADKKLKVANIYTERQRATYAAKLPRGVAVTAKASTGQGTPASQYAAAGGTPSSSSKSKTPKKRDRLIPYDCLLSIPSGRISDIEVELRSKLSLDKHTNAVSVLFRGVC